MLKKAILFVCVLALILVTGCSFVKKDVPMQVRPDIQIPDGEYLHYAISSAGKPRGEFVMVTKYVTKDTVKIYMDRHDFDSERGLNPDYTKWSWYTTIDLNKASETKFILSFYDYMVTQNKAKGRFYLDVDFGKELQALQKRWDGYNITESKTRVKNVDTNYSIWYSLVFMIWGGRVLDWEKGGNVLIWYEMMKDPAKGTLKKLGEEVVKTKLGDIKTVKVGWQVADPFLGPLLKQLTDAQEMNIEEGPAKRLVKLYIDFESESWLLDEAKIIK
jgi:hypothetical protein